MKNTKNQGIIHFRIFRWRGRYIGIGKEIGFIEESKELEEVKKKLITGTIALIKAVRTSPENLEASLNMKPPFRYLVYYYMAPVLWLIEFIKDSSSAGFYAFTTSLNLKNA